MTNFRKRTLTDKMICSLNSTKYSLFEKSALWIVRKVFDKPEYYNDIGNDPMVSVYMPTYNRGQLVVDRPLPSVLNQTYENFEFIILGDCCTDNTSLLISNFSDRRIKFHNLKSRKKRYPVEGDHAINHWLAGPVVAANKAISLAKGKWIARLDDSVIWTKDHIESLLRFAQEGNYEFVSGAVIEERFGKKETVRGHHANSPYFGFNKKSKIQNNNPIIGGTSTVLYRSYLRFFKYNINCWRKETNRVNDIDLFIRMYKAGVRMGFLDKVVCDMPPRPGEDSLAYEAFMSTLEEKKEHFSFES